MDKWSESVLSTLEPAWGNQNPIVVVVILVMMFLQCGRVQRMANVSGTGQALRWIPTEKRKT